MARRGQGEGSIRRRSDGRWEARVSLGWQGGKRAARSYYGKTRAQVQQAMVAALHDASQGRPIRQKGQTVGQYLTRWLEDSVKPHKSEGTYERYEECLRRHIVPVLGRVPLDKLTPQNVDAMLSGMRPTLGAYCRTVLRAALNKALKWGLVHRNAAALADPPRHQRRKGRFLEPEEAERLLSAAKGHKDEALFVLALMLGMREGELLGLPWSDVDLDGRQLQVRHALKHVRTLGQHGAFRLDNTKTDEGWTVPLPDAVVAVLRSHRKRQSAARLAAKPGRWYDSDHVFTSVTGRPQYVSTIGYHFGRLLKAAGLPAMRFHDLRHSCGSLLLARGVNMKAIQELLGHRDIRTTMNVYAHVLKSVRRQSADVMDALFPASQGD